MKVKGSLPNELTVLLNCMNGSVKNVVKHEGEIDWNSTFVLARTHKLYPILTQQILMNETTNLYYPEEFIQKLTNITNNKKFKLFQLTAELTRLANLFDKQNIPFLCLKGPVISMKLYGDAMFRPTKDLDLLVPFDRLKEAEDLLVENGYVEEYEGGSFEELNYKRFHHKNFFHHDSKIMVELHWRLHPNIYDEPLFEELWERKEHITIGGSSIPILGETDLFLFLITHGARHAWFRLRWLFDIHLYLQRTLDFEKILVASKKQGVDHMLVQALALSNFFFSTTIPKELESYQYSKKSEKLINMAIEIIEKNIDFNNSTTFHNWLLQKKYYLVLRVGWKQKTEYILQHFYPDQNDLNVLNLPRKFHLLYYPLRPILWVVRRIRRAS